MDLQKSLVFSILRSPNSLGRHIDLKTIHVQLIRTCIHRTSSFAVGNFVSHCFLLSLTSYAAHVFHQMPEPNSFVWNNMIRGYQQNHEPQKAFLFYKRMTNRGVEADRFTFLYTLKACCDFEDCWMGMMVHGQLLRFGVGSDVCVSTGLVGLYSGFGELSRAKRVFDEMPVTDVVSWTVIISGYVNGSSDMSIARSLFDEMPVKDLVACTLMITGYVKFGDMDNAREIFDRVPYKDMLMYNVMLGGYAKSGRVDDLLILFNEMNNRDLVTWNTVISGLTQRNRVNEAMGFFNLMQIENFKPNEVTLATILSGCARLGSLDKGKLLHSYIYRNFKTVDTLLGTALVDMYTKCGTPNTAHHVFRRLKNRDVAAWNVMITGFSMAGRSQVALELFNQMLKENVKPNEVTMVGVLTACVHGGLVEEGRKYFNRMTEDLEIKPTVEHYGCMVDLLGRAGMLDEAHDFIQHMPILPHTGVWGALLGACKIHNNVRLAECAIEHLLKLDPEDGGYTAIMCNIYASAGMWDDVVKMRKKMVERRICKMPGRSVIEVDGLNSEFGAGDHSHAITEDIYELVDEISEQLKRTEHVELTEEAF